MQAVNYAARTDVGKVREHNEDSYCVNTDLSLYVIADGMGGHASGEVASEIAVNTIEQQVAQGDSLLEAIKKAHWAIIKGVETGAGKPGMGSTVVALQLHDDDYTLAWMGDSRAYLWDQGLSQISKDHSLVQMLVDTGQISKAEARVHPRKNIIYQNLGDAKTDDLQVSVKHGVLYQNQKVILCSDGLSDEVDDEQMAGLVARADNDEALVEELVTAAIENGGRDNITVIVISAAKDAPVKSAEVPMQDEVDDDTLQSDE